VCAEVAPFDYVAGADLLTTPDPLIVALDQIQDPQNLGAICRSAEVLGATGVAIPERRSALVTPAVCKASAGAVEHLPIALVRNLADFLIQARDAGSWIYGAAAEGGVAHDQVDFSGGAVLVLGSEGRGLRPRVAGVCDQLVTIIQAGTIDSLNVSAAAAILLDAAARSRRAGDAGR
jgi:23S rRNA (guanosine2251-2'-O)-methyltransferase